MVSVIEVFQEEMRWALEMKKNIILMDESDERHDAEMNYDFHIAKAPDDIKQVLEELDSKCVPWYRGKEFRGMCIDLVIKNSEGCCVQKLKKQKKGKTT